MVKIHPDNIQNIDEMLIKSIVCSLLLCACTCVGLIIIIVSSIENNINHGSS